MSLYDYPMVTLAITPLPSPLRADDGGVVRVGATRVTLDTLVGAYRDGNTAEEIVQQYPTLSLADVHGAIAYYLTHLADVEEYLRRRIEGAAETRRAVEANCDQRGVRERLLAREASRKTTT
jgi:uncharacterized protein (DUF433 family)